MLHTIAKRVSPLLALLFVSSPLAAFASGGGGEGGHGGSEANEVFQEILVLLAVISVAYLVTHLLLERIQRRFGLVSGVEYILLGALVGPVLGLLDPTTLSKFTPALVLGTGSLGLMAGLNFNFKRFTAIDYEALRVALWISMITVLILLVIPLGLMYVFLEMEVVLRWMRGIMCVGAIAMVADPSPLQSLRRFMSARGDAADAAVRVAKFCSAAAIITFGLLFCMFDHNALLFEHYAMVEWFGVHLIWGIGFGGIFTTFLRRDFEEDKILTIVIGMVIFTSGIAYYLRLSPIFINLILGVVLANTCSQSAKVERMLDSVERPLYILLFFFAGAMITTDAPLWAYALAIPYLALRSIARLTGGVVAMRTTSPDLDEVQIPALGRVMLAPGALSVAMLLDFQQVFGTLPASSIIYSAMIGSILASEVLSYIRTRSWLVDYTDVPQSTITQAFSGEDVEVR